MFRFIVLASLRYAHFFFFPVLFLSIFHFYQNFLIFNILLSLTFYFTFTLSRYFSHQISSISVIVIVVSTIIFIIISIINTFILSWFLFFTVEKFYRVEPDSKMSQPQFLTALRLSFGDETMKSENIGFYYFCDNSQYIQYLDSCLLFFVYHFYAI